MRLVLNWLSAELLISDSARKEGRENSCGLLLYYNTSDLHGTKSIISLLTSAIPLGISVA